MITANSPPRPKAIKCTGLQKRLMASGLSKVLISRCRLCPLRVGSSHCLSNVEPDHPSLDHHWTLKLAGRYFGSSVEVNFEVDFFSEQATWYSRTLPSETTFHRNKPKNGYP